MSRLVGIVALVIAFAWPGFILWRLANPRRPQETKIQLQPKPIANIGAVQRDLCSLAQAELDYRHLTGRYAEIHELAHERRTEVSDLRWPYRYMLYLPPESNRFLIVAVSLTPIDAQPRVLQIDDQLQIQTRSHPAQTFACK